MIHFRHLAPIRHSVWLAAELAKPKSLHGPGNRFALPRPPNSPVFTPIRQTAVDGGTVGFYHSRFDYSRMTQRLK